MDYKYVINKITMNKFHRKWIVIILITILFLTGFTPLCFADTRGKTLKVGYMDYSGFIDKQEDGSYSGYAADYLANISKYTNYNYEYVYDTWDNLLKKLENGDIDLLCSAQYTAERAKKFQYSKYPIGYTQGLLYTTKGNKELLFEDFTAFEGMTVGAIKSSAMEQIFINYAKSNGFTCKIKEYDSEEQLVEELNKGNVDAICSEHLANHKDLSLLARFGADAFYFISYKGNPYMNDINDAIQQIKVDVDFESNLFHKYYDSSTAATTLQFTAEEREYIKNCGTLTVALNGARAPFSELDKKTGKMTGINVDILNEISKQSGLKFKFVKQTVGKTGAELMDSGKYDIICGIERDNFTTNKTIVATSAFMESSVVAVGKSGKKIDLNSKLTAAIPKSYGALQKKLKKDYPNMKLELYNTDRECLDVVAAGDADIIIQNTHILSVLLQEPEYENLDILPFDIMTEHTAMAVLRSSDPRLLSILNKSIESIDDATINSYLVTHTFATPYKYTIGDFLFKFKIPISIIVILVVIAFILLLRMAKIRRNNEIKLESRNKLLTDAVSQADRASTAKSEFLSRMSHEIRTPMNAIVGLTTLAKQHEDDMTEVDGYLNKIQVSSKVLLNIINDVLDMSAIESNKLKIAHNEFDIKQVLNGICTIYYPQCNDKGISFNMETDISHEILVGDNLRVEQILLNLLSNAFKFTEKGGTINIRVTETAFRKNMVFLRFEVSDNGCGMSEEMLERIFKPFEQETANIAQKYGGSGLGLSIVKNLVDLMHGAINVSSDKGQGTKFTVDLPIDYSGKTCNKTDDGLNDIKVIAVDDDISAREYTEIILKRIGVTYKIASNGEEALKIMNEARDEGEPYNVCLIDWKMDGMNGLELTKRIRENNNNELIIIVSAYDESEIAEAAKEAGADHFVSKPLFQSTLFNTLMTLTNGKIGVEDVPKEIEYDFSGNKILLAEDQELNAEIAIEFLNIVNLEVEHAQTGKQAVEMFEASEPGEYALILMDVQMPEMNGYEATKAIRKLSREDGQTIPIFAMTANAFNEDVSIALSSGMNGHIAKPIDTEILYDSINKAINNKL